MEALAAGMDIHALARIVGTSMEMIEHHDRTLLDGALESIAGALNAFDVAGTPLIAANDGKKLPDHSS
jgi:hypothetical protein